MFGLCDCNNFYASCERVFNPLLEGKPVIVLSNGDGCIVARSNEAKALGIQMGEPLFKVRELVKKHKIHIFSSNYTLYGDMSSRVMDILGSFTPNLEIYSIDEAFLSLFGFGRYNLSNYAAEIRKTVKQNTGIPICIGIAPTKTLAKIANRLAKKNPEAKGIWLLESTEQSNEALQRVAVEDIWGIGNQYAKKLAAWNIRTAWDLANRPTQWASKHLGGVVGMRLIEELNGNSCLNLEELILPKKSIACTRSFGTTVTTMGELSEAISVYTSRAAEKLRKQQSVANAINVFIQTNRFATDATPFNGSITVNLSVPTSDTSELIHYARIGLKKIYRDDLIYKKAGIILTGLTQQAQIQTSLFDNRDRKKSTKLMEAVDGINAKLGRDTVTFASAGTDNRWKQKPAYTSNRYTTRWGELMLVK